MTGLSIALVSCSLKFNLYGLGHGELKNWLGQNYAHKTRQASYGRFAMINIFCQHLCHRGYPVILRKCLLLNEGCIGANTDFGGWYSLDLS